jgi:16S rRNA (adenine1518-N6/adenine1519-N6)-dimethyltransferase
MPFITKSALIPLLNQLGIRLNKSKGQCYLIDQNLVNFIVNQAELDPNTDTVLEIGPGLGTLSDFLAEKSQRLYLIEMDSKMVHFLVDSLQSRYSVLKKENNSTEDDLVPEDVKIVIYSGDALEIIFPSVQKIVSNIPYQISGPLILKLIETWQYKLVILMVQKEFADHLLAEPNSPTYSRISAATQLYLDIKRLRTVPRTCFFPEPRVDSVILKITFNSSISLDSPEFEFRNQYLEFLRGIFPYKNKILRKAIGFYQKANPSLASNFLYFQELINDPQIGSLKVHSLNANKLFTLCLWAINGRKNAEDRIHLYFNNNSEDNS